MSKEKVKEEKKEEKKEEAKEKNSLKKYLPVAISMAALVFIPVFIISGDALLASTAILVLLAVVIVMTIFLYFMSLGFKHLKVAIEEKNNGESEKERRRKRKSKRAYRQLRILLPAVFVLWAIISFIISYAISPVTSIVITPTTFNQLIIFLSIFLIGPITWILKSIRVLDLDEMAVLMILGTGVKYIDDGLHYVPWFFRTGLRVYSKELFNLDYPETEIITADGKYKGKDYSAQAIPVDSTAYVQFPQDINLLDIAERRIPKDEKGLLNWTEESVISSVRLALGDRTWKEATESKSFEEIRKAANENFRSKEGALIIAGFPENNIRLAVEKVILPEKLKRALEELDVARLARDASFYRAEEEAEKTFGPLIYGLAEEKGVQKETIQRNLSYNQKNFIANNKELWENSWDMIQRRFTDAPSYKDIHFNQEGAGNGGGFTTEIAKIIALIETIRSEMSDGSKAKSGPKDDDLGAEEEREIQEKQRRIATFSS